MNTITLPDEFVLPAYDGGSIANVPATAAAMLGVPFDGLSPLRGEAWRPLGGDVQRVVVLLVDAFGWNLLRRVEDDLEWLFERAIVRQKLTSVFPSTTVAALSSLWTGAAPAQHGFVGFRLFLPRQAVLSQMIHFTPVFARFPDALVEAGLEPGAFLRAPGAAEQLAAAGVPTYSFKSYTFADSTLSQMHGRGVRKTFGIVTAADMYAQLRRLLEETAGQPLYAVAYWDAVDSLSHRYSFDHPSVAAELRSVLTLLRTELWQPLSPDARAGTALFIAGDHGQIPTPSSQALYLADHPELEKMLLMRPAGEPRTLYLYARQGRQEDVVYYFRERLDDSVVALSATAALDAGLFGPPPHAPETARRLGDVVALMRGRHVLLDPAEAESVRKMRGRHGGLTAGEMEIPWLGFRLDSTPHFR